MENTLAARQALVGEYNYFVSVGVSMVYSFGRDQFGKVKKYFGVMATEGRITITAPLGKWVVKDRVQFDNKPASMFIF